MSKNKHFHRYFSLLTVLTVLTAAFVSGCCYQQVSCDPPPANESIYFVQITDTHLDVDDPGDLEDHYGATEMAINYVNELPVDVDFVAVTGDIMHEKTGDTKAEEKTLAMFGKLEPPVHYLPGNHDILYGPGPDELLGEYESAFGAADYGFEHGGVWFIMFNSELLAEGTSDVIDKQIAVLKRLIRASQGKRTVIFIHSSPAPDLYGGKFHYGWPKDAAQKFTAAINSSQANVIAVIGGHFHREEKHYFGDVPVYLTGAVANFWGRQSVFKLFHIDPQGRITYRLRYLGRGN
jgi:3',5'-cyclic AMP phosphodiesterase CpdA